MENDIKIENSEISSQEMVDMSSCMDFCKDKGAKYFSFKAHEITGTAGECICANRSELRTTEATHSMDSQKGPGKNRLKTILF